jgi:hypothetical protein
MKKITFLFFLISHFSITGHNQTFGFSIVKPPTITNSYEAAKSLSLNSIIHLSAKQFSELTGKKMNIWDKLSFSIMKIKMKHDLKKNPNLTLKYYLGKEGRKRLETVWWILIGLAGIFLLAILIFIIAYAIGSNGE